MGLIEFADKDGVRWRVWHVDTPASRAHLMDPQFRKGWLVFEREDGTDRRRLSQVPDDWTALPRERLALLCAVAGPVEPPQLASRPHGRGTTPPARNSGARGAP